MSLLEAKPENIETPVFQHNRSVYPHLMRTFDVDASEMNNLSDQDKIIRDESIVTIEDFINSWGISPNGSPFNPPQGRKNSYTALWHGTVFSEKNETVVISYEKSILSPRKTQTTFYWGIISEAEFKISHSPEDVADYALHQYVHHTPSAKPINQLATLTECIKAYLVSNTNPDNSSTDNPGFEERVFERMSKATRKIFRLFMPSSHDF